MLLLLLGCTPWPFEWRFVQLSLEFSRVAPLLSPCLRRLFTTRFVSARGAGPNILHVGPGSKSSLQAPPTARLFIENARLPASPPLCMRGRCVVCGMYILRAHSVCVLVRVSRTHAVSEALKVHIHPSCSSAAPGEQRGCCVTQSQRLRQLLAG